MGLDSSVNPGAEFFRRDFVAWRREGEYLENRAARGRRRKFERALGKVKDVEPEERDRRR